MAHKQLSITPMALVLVLALTLPDAAGAGTRRVQGESARPHSAGWLTESWLGSVLAHLLPGDLAKSLVAPGTAVEPNPMDRAQTVCEPSPFPPTATTNKGSACDPNG